MWAVAPARAGARPKRCRSRMIDCPGRYGKSEGVGVTVHQLVVPAAGRDAGGVRCIPCVGGHTLDSRAGIDL